jgi:hypothetical protein
MRGRKGGGGLCGLLRDATYQVSGFEGPGFSWNGQREVESALEPLTGGLGGSLIESLA